MKKKQFKAESKKLLDMMINSIYTHKEIFLRELISNASDAVDKLYFRSLTDDTVGMKKEDFCIRITPDREARTLTVSDNGIGMTAAELEENLGVIARSGSKAFRDAGADAQAEQGVEIIGQFGVGFYSAFMVSKKVQVLSRAFGEETANLWESDGADGYTVTPAEKETVGTDVILYLNDDSEEQNYSEFLDEYRLTSLVKKYSNYIRYPIRMLVSTTKPIENPEEDGPKTETVTEDKTLNSMLPLWKKNKSEITEEEYAAFYKEVYFDYEDPLHVIHTKTEGQATYNALLFVPSHAPYDYYTKEYEKGLQLYSKGVLITDKCADLLPDYFNFVRGLVDSEDLSLNISRELLQHDHQLRLIARVIEKKIRSELTKLLENDREKYEKFFEAFGRALKFGVYNDYGVHREDLQDLLLFKSSKEEKYVTLGEYVSRMAEGQKAIYYAAGESLEKIKILPQAEAAAAKGFEVLYLTEYVDEFSIKSLMNYKEHPFMNVCDAEADFGSEDEKEALASENEAAADLFAAVKEALGGKVEAVRFTNKLSSQPACLSSEGMVSAEMERVLNAMPGAGDVKAQYALEINAAHPIAEKLKTLLNEDKEQLAKYAKLLYGEARLIGGMSIEDPAEFAALISGLMV